MSISGIMCLASLLSEHQRWVSQVIEKKEKQIMELKEVLEERGKNYGPFEDHARITQNIKRAIFKNDKNLLLDSQREALEMIAHKIGRIVNGDPNYADSWRDIAGYATLIVKELEGKV